MRKRLVIIGVLLSLLGFLFLYVLAHGQADRTSELINSRSVLRQAYDEYEATGRLPPSNGSWQIFPYTNELRVGTRALQPAAATTLPGAPSAGLFVITTTHELIYLSSNRNPVLLSDPSYRVPFWRNGY
jgi:hypothetical protein